MLDEIGFISELGVELCKDCLHVNPDAAVYLLQRPIYYTIKDEWR